jgi:hypothetical protein
LSIGNQQGSYFPRAGLYLGILGGVSLLVFVLIFQEDWVNRYYLMIAMVPLFLVALLVLKRLPLLSGSLLVALGVAALILDILFNVGYPGQVAGRGLGFTVVFVSIPLIASGILFLLSGIKRRKSAKRYNRTPI